MLSLEGRWVSRAISHRQEPIEPPIKPKSIAPRFTGASASFPVTVSMASHRSRCHAHVEARWILGKPSGSVETQIGLDSFPRTLVQRNPTYSSGPQATMVSQCGQTLRLRSNFSRRSWWPHASHFSQASEGSPDARAEDPGLLLLRNQAAMAVRC